MKSALAAAATALVTAFALGGCASPDPSGAAGTTQGGTTSEQSSTPKAEVTYLENGDHVVGTDINAGVYRAEVEEGAISLCTVTQTSESGKVMDIRNANEGSVVFTVTNKAGSVVAFSGCAKIAEAKNVLRKNAKPGN